MSHICTEGAFYVTVTASEETLKAEKQITGSGRLASKLKN
jgi:hypothetical protein